MTWLISTHKTIKHSWVWIQFAQLRITTKYWNLTEWKHHNYKWSKYFFLPLYSLKWTQNQGIHFWTDKYLKENKQQKLLSTLILFETMQTMSKNFIMIFRMGKMMEKKRKRASVPWHLSSVREKYGRHYITLLTVSSSLMILIRLYITIATS